MQDQVALFGGLLATAVTAVATVLLWRVTAVLATETKRMVEAAARPQVVVTIEPSPWASNYADLKIANTGNAAAFDIETTFDPPLPSDPDRPGAPVPFGRVSVLRPGQQLGALLGSFGPLIGASYTVNISWRRTPGEGEREVLSYSLNMAEMDGRSWLGSDNPLIQISQDLRKIKEDFGRVAGGTRKIGVDVTTSLDRLHERRVYLRLRQRQIREAAASAVHASPPPPPPAPAPSAQPTEVAGTPPKRSRVKKRPNVERPEE